MKKHILGSVLVLLILSACASRPYAPRLGVMPGSQQSLQNFQQDDLRCRQQAKAAMGDKTPEHIQQETIGRDAAIGTFAGALLGAVLGRGNHSIAAGAATGLIYGGLIGAGDGYAKAENAREDFDIRYIQCMYNAGHRIPVNRVKYIEVIEPQSYIEKPATIPPPAGKKTFGVPPDFKQP